MELISKGIKKLREDKGLTHAALGEEISVGQSQIGKIEKGLSETSITNLTAIAEVLGVTLQDLMVPDFKHEPSENKEKTSSEEKIVFEYNGKGSSTRLEFPKDAPEMIVRAAISKFLKRITDAEIQLRSWVCYKTCRLWRYCGILI